MLFELLTYRDSAASISPRCYTLSQLSSSSHILIFLINESSFNALRQSSLQSTNKKIVVALFFLSSPTFWYKRSAASATVTGSFSSLFIPLLYKSCRSSSSFAGLSAVMR